MYCDKKDCPKDCEVTCTRGVMAYRSCGFKFVQEVEVKPKATRKKKETPEETDVSEDMED